jgi:hypothetical protein
MRDTPDMQERRPPRMMHEWADAGAKDIERPQCPGDGTLRPAKKVFPSFMLCAGNV